MSDYLIHFNKNHDPKTGQFAKGDGNGDGKVGPNGKPLNGDGREKGVYSAKIENYKKGTAFRDAYYIDKNGNKRSYQSYKEMPVDAQQAERARAKGKQTVKKVAGVAATVLGSAAIMAGTLFVAGKVAQREPGYSSIDPMGPLKPGYYKI